MSGYFGPLPSTYEWCFDLVSEEWENEDTETQVAARMQIAITPKCDPSYDGHIVGEHGLAKLPLLHEGCETLFGCSKKLHTRAAVAAHMAKLGIPPKASRQTIDGYPCVCDCILPKPNYRNEAFVCKAHQLEREVLAFAASLRGQWLQAVQLAVEHCCPVTGTPPSTRPRLATAPGFLLRVILADNARINIVPERDSAGTTDTISHRIVSELAMLVAAYL